MSPGLDVEKKLKTIATSIIVTKQHFQLVKFCIFKATIFFSVFNHAFQVQ